MGAKVFDDAGNGSGTWEDATDWDPVGVPADDDTIQISADCAVSTDYSDRTFEDLRIDIGDTLTVENVGDIRFDTNTVDIFGTLHLDIGGAAQFSNIQINVFVDTGEIVFDGGILTYVRDTTNKSIYFSGTITGTANAGNVGGDFIINSNTTNYPKCEFGVASVIAGNAGARLVFKGDAGAQKPSWTIVSGCVVSNVDLDQFYSIYLKSGNGVAHFDNCLLHGANGDLAGALQGTGGRVTFQDCFIYYMAGVNYSTGLGLLLFSGGAFGEEEDTSPAANTQDFNNGFGAVRCYNTLFSSVTFATNPQYGGEFISTSHDQDEADWLQYQGLGHVAQPEFGAGAQGGSGTAVKCVTSAVAADTDQARFRRLVAVIPATHGDVIAVTLYIKGTNTKVAKLRIDPDGIYGTTQSYAETADGNWNQRTIPNYTVNVSGGAGTKVSIPIYLDMYGASETWYYDTLDWTIS